MTELVIILYSLKKYYSLNKENYSLKKKYSLIGPYFSDNSAREYNNYIC